MILHIFSFVYNLLVMDCCNPLRSISRDSSRGTWLGISLIVEVHCHELELDELELHELPPLPEDEELDELLLELLELELELLVDELLVELVDELVVPVFTRITHPHVLEPAGTRLYVSITPSSTHQLEPELYDISYHTNAPLLSWV